MPQTQGRPTLRPTWICEATYIWPCPLCSFQVSSPGAQLARVSPGVLSSTAKRFLKGEATGPPPELQDTFRRLEAYVSAHVDAVHGAANGSAQRDGAPQ